MSLNKVAFITGASQGIGSTLAKGLASEGWEVALLARNKQKLESLSKELQSESLIFAGSVDDEKFVAEAISQTEDKLGAIGLVINNAAINHRGTLDPSYQEFDEMMSINVKGVYNVLREVTPRLVERGAGHIINISSLAGKVGFPGSGSYGATKFAVSGLSESLYNELVPQGIKVTSICPSWVDTEMASYAPLAPKQMIQQDDILKTVNYLLDLSPAASPKEVVIECAGTL